MKKELIKQRFSRSLKTYQTNAIVQKRMAEKLVSLIEKKSFEDILELGCGTGFLTELINKNFNYKSYTAIDIVQECAPYIKKINSSINFINQDIEVEKLEGKYDLIVSNAVFQWINDFEGFINNLKTNLKDGGTIVFTTFGQKNFEELSKVSDISLHYYSTNELKDKLSAYEVIVLEEETIEQNFNSIRDMFEHMKKTGVNAISEKIWGLKEINNFKTRYKEEFNSIHLTYNPIYIVLR